MRRWGITILIFIFICFSVPAMAHANLLLRDAIKRLDLLLEPSDQILLWIKIRPWIGGRDIETTAWLLQVQEFEGVFILELATRDYSIDRALHTSDLFVSPSGAATLTQPFAAPNGTIDFFSEVEIGTIQEIRIIPGYLPGEFSLIEDLEALEVARGQMIQAAGPYIQWAYRDMQQPVRSLTIPRDRPEYERAEREYIVLRDRIRAARSDTIDVWKYSSEGVEEPAPISDSISVSSRSDAFRVAVESKIPTEEIREKRALLLLASLRYGEEEAHRRRQETDSRRSSERRAFQRDYGPFTRRQVQILVEVRDQVQRGEVQIDTMDPGLTNWLTCTLYLMGDIANLKQAFLTRLNHAIENPHISSSNNRHIRLMVRTIRQMRPR